LLLLRKEEEFHLAPPENLFLSTEIHVVNDPKKRNPNLSEVIPLIRIGATFALFGKMSQIHEQRFL